MTLKLTLVRHRAGRSGPDNSGRVVSPSPRRTPYHCVRHGQPEMRSCNTSTTCNPDIRGGGDSLVNPQPRRAGFECEQIISSLGVGYAKEDNPERLSLFGTLWKK